ncbi:MAG: SpoIIE family protein phosphatase [Kiritimatiellae bacterium]|nr:SpoIIE family protein phosphatase [Kiritimatiellia bacterium]
MTGFLIQNRYALKDRIRSDPTSEEYSADDQRLTIRVLLKLVKKSAVLSMDMRYRYRTLMEQLKKLSVDSVLKVEDLGEWDGREYVVYKAWHGVPLSSCRMIRRSDETMRIIRQVIQALQEIHRVGIIHGALSSDAILLDSTRLRQVKIRDFGKAILLDLSGISDEKDVLDTFGYLSPEQSGILRKPLDIRSDIYSLGIVFYELLAGRLPYYSMDVNQLIYEHIAKEPDRPGLVCPGVPPMLEAIVLKMMAKDPDDRYQSSTGVLADLDEYQRLKESGLAAESIRFEVGRHDKLQHLTYATRLIGRQKELQQLEAGVEQAKASQGGVCFVSGEPGAGKSRLVNELRASIHRLGGLFVGGKCYQYDSSTPYKIFAEAIGAYVNKVKRLNRNVREKHVRRLRQSVGELGGEVQKVVPCIMELLGTPPPLVELDPEKERSRFLTVFTDFVLSLGSSEEPLVLFLDDLQWADEGSLEVLGRLADLSVSRALFVIGSYRSNDVDDRHPLHQLIGRLRDGQIPVANIMIDRLTLPETTEMIASIFLEDIRQVGELANVVQERAQGNPFFIIELLRTLISQGVISCEEDHYHFFHDRLQKVRLPDNVVDLLLQRVHEFTREEIRLFSWAAVMGRMIRVDWLSHLLGKDVDETLMMLEKGIRHQIIVRELTGNEPLHFVHDRIQEAFYKDLPPAERIPMHQRIAELMESSVLEAEQEDVVYDLAYHYYLSGELGKALSYSMKAGEKAQGACAFSQAADLFAIAREIIEKTGQDQQDIYLRVLERLGDIYRLSGNYDQAVSFFKNCERLIPAADQLHRALVLEKMAGVFFEKGEIAESIQYIRQGLETFKVRIPVHSASVLFRTLREMGLQALHLLFPRVFLRSEVNRDERDRAVTRFMSRLVYAFYFDDMKRSFYFYLRSLNRAERGGYCGELVYLYIMGGPVWTCIPWYARGRASIEKGMKIAEKIGDARALGTGYAAFAYLYRIMNRPDESYACANKGIEILRRIGEYYELGIAFVFRNHCNWATSRFDQGMRENEEFLELCRQTKLLQSLSWALFNRGYFSALKGCTDESHFDDLKKGCALSRQTRDKPDTLVSLAFLAFAYMRAENYTEAINTAEEIYRLIPTFLDRSSWIYEMFPICALIYLETLLSPQKMTDEERRLYLRRAEWFCRKSRRIGRLYRYIKPYSLQVTGTYHWLVGKPARAMKYWQKGVACHQRETPFDMYRLGCFRFEMARHVLRKNPRDTQAREALMEARRLFDSCGAELDVRRASAMLRMLNEEEDLADSRDVLTYKRHLETLLSVMQSIGSIFEQDELLEQILEHSLRVSGAERAFLLLFNSKSNQLELKLAKGFNTSQPVSSFSYEGCQVSLMLVEQVLQLQRPLISSTLNADACGQELMAYKVKQAMCVPLNTQKRKVGVLYLDNRLAEGIFSDETLTLMESVAIQSGISLENAFLVQSLMEQDRLKQEMSIGREIQTSLVPHGDLQLLGLRVMGWMQPANEIGGDYYDYMIRPGYNGSGDRLGVAIGDVSGKGLGAGLYMAMAKTLIRTLSQENLSTDVILKKTNRMMLESSNEWTFMSMVYLEWNPDQKSMTYCGAGHEHILVYHQASRTVDVVKSGGIVLGVVADNDELFTIQPLDVHPGDKVMLYSDGITEARNADGQEYGLDALRQSVERNGSMSLDNFIEAIKLEVNTFIGDGLPYDDMTLVVMEYAADH